MMRSRKWLTGIALVGAAVGVAGCGGGGDAGAGNTSAAGDRQERVVAFARCMREHGVDIPDPAPGQRPGVAVRIDPRVDASELQDAQAACQEFAPTGEGLSPEQRKEIQESALAFARCMRAEGVSIPDPKPGQPAVVLGIEGKVDPGSQTFRDAQKKCGSPFAGAALPGDAP